MDKNMKALLGINKIIDSDYEKLYDKLKELELSHNRQRMYLIKLKSFFGDMKPQKLYECDLMYVNKWLDNALFSNGRINERIKNG